MTLKTAAQLIAATSTISMSEPMIVVALRIATASRPTFAPLLADASRIALADAGVKTGKDTRSKPRAGRGKSRLNVGQIPHHYGTWVRGSERGTVMRPGPIAAARATRPVMAFRRGFSR